MRVERFVLFFPPVLWSVKRGETEYGIGAIPLGGYVKITGMTAREELAPEIAYRAYHRQPPWKRIVVIAAGPVMNLLIAFAVLWAVFVFDGEIVGTTKVIDSIDTKGAAAKVLRPGDRLLAVDGVRGNPTVLRLQIGTHTCLGKQIEGCRGTPTRITFVRGGKTLDATVRPIYSVAEK